MKTVALALITYTTAALGFVTIRDKSPPPKRVVASQEWRALQEALVFRHRAK